MFLFFDTETTGLPKRWDVPLSDFENWPRLVQLGWVLSDSQGRVQSQGCAIVKPAGFGIAPEAVRIHGITAEHAADVGQDLKVVLDEFCRDLSRAETVVAHNISFDEAILGAEFLRVYQVNRLLGLRRRCTMRESIFYCRIPSRYGFKWPTLGELYYRLFQQRNRQSHDALADSQACLECFFELKKRGYCW